MLVMSKPPLGSAGHAARHRSPGPRKSRRAAARLRADACRDTLRKPFPRHRVREVRRQPSAVWSAETAALVTRNRPQRYRRAGRTRTPASSTSGGQPPRVAERGFDKSRRSVNCLRRAALEKARGDTRAGLRIPDRQRSRKRRRTSRRSRRGRAGTRSVSPISPIADRSVRARDSRRGRSPGSVVPTPHRQVKTIASPSAPMPIWSVPVSFTRALADSPIKESTVPMASSGATDRSHNGMFDDEIQSAFRDLGTAELKAVGDRPRRW